MNCSNFAILFKHKRELSEGDIESGREETPSQGNTIERRVKKLEFDLKCILMMLFRPSFCQIFMLHDYLTYMNLIKKRVGHSYGFLDITITM